MNPTRTRTEDPLERMVRRGVAAVVGSVMVIAGLGILAVGVVLYALVTLVQVLAR